MNTNAWMLLVTYLVVLMLLAWPLGRRLVAVADGRFPRWMAPFEAAERGLYRLAGIDPSAGMGWRQYAFALIAFNFLGVMAVYALQRFQVMLPLARMAYRADFRDRSRSYPAGKLNIICGGRVRDAHCLARSSRGGAPRSPRHDPQQ